MVQGCIAGLHVKVFIRYTLIRILQRVTCVFDPKMLSSVFDSEASALVEVFMVVEAQGSRVTSRAVTTSTRHRRGPHHIPIHRALGVMNYVFRLENPVPSESTNPSTVRVKEFRGKMRSVSVSVTNGLTEY